MSERLCVGLIFAVVASVIGVAAALAPAKDAAPGRPVDERAVLLQVPVRTDEAAMELARLRARRAAHPDDLASALALARSQIESSRRDGDPRPLGHAEATLLPFAQQAGVSSELLVLRATIAQARHQFEPALADLNRALQLAPDDAQALLTQASVLTVLGHHEQARAACLRLRPLTRPLFTLACGASVDVVSGHGQQARETLERALREAQDGAERGWLLSLRCEAEYWLASDAVAEPYCRAALQQDGSDRYTRALLLDVLLDQGRNSEARRLAEGRESDDSLALRVALAAHAERRSDAGPRAQQLRARFAQNRQRDEQLHQREEARLLLATAPGESGTALRLARENFAAQREPWDTRLLLEAALQARDRQAAQPALSWLEQSRFESPRLRALAARLQELP